MTTRPIGERVRFRKLALFRQLGYEPHAIQVLVHRSRAKRRVLACGTRLGKSTCGVMETMAALLAPGDATLGWLVCPTYQLTERIFKKVLALFNEHFPHRIIEFDPRERRIVIVNLGGGLSELRSKSADRPESLLGEALDFLVLDEAASLRDDIWGEYLAPRLIDRHGWSLILSTPKGYNWFWEQFQRGEFDPAYECWQAPSRQNPHVNAEVIEAERARLPSDTFAQQYEAEFLGVPKGPCKACGGPRDDVPDKVTAPVGEHSDDFIPKCSACGMFVDAEGRCIVKRQSEWYATLDVDRPWSDPISSTLYSWNSYSEWKLRGG